MSKGKFSSPRDEVLHRMTLDGWGNRSDGDVQAPTGTFSLVVISEAEKAECASAMSEALEELRIDMPVGAFVVREDQQGFVTVEEFPTEAAATVAYTRLEGEYGTWVG